MRELLRSRRKEVDFVDLLAAARAGWPWAVEELADRYLPRLNSFAAARGAADPQGIADVVLLSVLGRLDELEFEAPEQFWAYLCLAARSRVIDEHRAAKPIELVGDALALEALRPAPGPALADFDEVVVERDHVSTLLLPLTDEQRQVMELRFLDDLSIEETANRTGRSQGAIKGLQRRAINAIIAAVALALLALGLRVLGDEGSDRLGSDPAGRGGSRLEQPETGPGTIDGDGLTEGGGPGPPVGGAGPGEVPPIETTGTTSRDGVDGSTGDDERFTVTVGSGRATALDTSGQPGPAPFHGVRIPCAVSHLSHSDPIRFPDQPGVAPALIHWGNTSVDAASASVDLTGVGNGTCEGGTTDRSAYFMPALFDEAHEVVVPDWVLVEYKAFGGPGFDRSTIQPIPAGLQLVSGPAVRGGSDMVRAPSGDGESVTLYVLFPTCVALDGAGRPVLASGDRSSHLSYQADEAGRSDGCPATHPFRIPQLSFTLRYRVPFDTDWYLADQTGPTPRHGAPTGAAISAWDREAMADVVVCLRDLLEGCWFGVDDDGGGGRSQLPERFAGPDGQAVYDDGLVLAERSDRTPFGPLVTATPSR